MVTIFFGWAHASGAGFSAHVARGPAVPVRFEGFDLRLSELVDAVDGEAEKTRLTKQVATLEQQIANLERRLANPGRRRTWSSRAAMSWRA